MFTSSALFIIFDLQAMQASAEADTFFCFVELLSGFRDHFCQQLDNSVVGIRSTITKLSQFLKEHDEELWRHLEMTTKVNPQFYAFRWITLLLTQEFNFPDSLLIWDTLLSDPEGPLVRHPGIVRLKTQRDGHAAMQLGPYPHGTMQGGDGRVFLGTVRGEFKFSTKRLQLARNLPVIAFVKLAIRQSWDFHICCRQCVWGGLLEVKRERKNVAPQGLGRRRLCNPETETLLRVCCAMLIIVRRRLLAGDFTSNLKLLQNYPSTNISHLLYVANKLRVKSV
ncbi:hypothetical protein MTR67_041671 [Solanum verrucosum]|uniref:Rab-GAP TBC domain-containing protein n=1 Tax=Solanum verrucosum TaxID=315347 RepID=A0AAF0ZR02_SOLVR|nr:hypothetical protein MTR67_041671 [Solanum verrucosum]